MKGSESPLAFLWDIAFLPHTLAGLSPPPALGCAMVSSLSRPLEAFPHLHSLMSPSPAAPSALPPATRSPGNQGPRRRSSAWTTAGSAPRAGSRHQAPADHQNVNCVWKIGYRCPWSYHGQAPDIPPLKHHQSVDCVWKIGYRRPWLRTRAMRRPGLPLHSSIMHLILCSHYRSVSDPRYAPVRVVRQRPGAAGSGPDLTPCPPLTSSRPSMCSRVSGAPADRCNWKWARSKRPPAPVACVQTVSSGQRTLQEVPASSAWGQGRGRGWGGGGAENIWQGEGVPWGSCIIGLGAGQRGWGGAENTWKGEGVPLGTMEGPTCSIQPYFWPELHTPAHTPAPGVFRSQPWLLSYRPHPAAPPPLPH